MRYGYSVGDYYRQKNLSTANKADMCQNSLTASKEYCRDILSINLI